MTGRLLCSEQISENYKIIRENISRAMERAGRKDSVRLMAVTKTVEPEKICFAAGLGIDLLGENRVQEFLEKREKYPEKCEVHFIGALQSNKVKYIIDKVSMIHSVDSVRLAGEVSSRAVKAGVVMDVLLEVNIGAEETKSGVLSERLDELVFNVLELPGLRLRGLMAIPPRDIEGGSEKYFAMMQRLFSDYGGKLNGHDRVLFDTLSMGMSQDYEIAIEYGSNIVRIGSLLFGKRK